MQVVKTISRPDFDRQVLIVRRSDGRFSYQIRFLADTGWGPPGPYLGIYDSPETAEVEALARVRWPESS
jgi:hypothetical protein